VGSTDRAQALGDSAWALFDGLARAIRCGLAVRESLRPLGLDVRVGVHTGEVEHVEHRPRGIAVHVAARVVAAAGAGEVLVTQTTHDLVEGSGLEFEDRGVHELKGIEPVRRLYAALR
jgi:class 3 adenylate cyclase